MMLPMKTAAFTDGNREGAEKQTDGATEDVKHQERESHARHPFGTCNREIGCRDSVRAL
jgi:hypothetical protein